MEPIKNQSFFTTSIKLWNIPICSQMIVDNLYQLPSFNSKSKLEHQPQETQQSRNLAREKRYLIPDLMKKLFPFIFLIIGGRSTRVFPFIKLLLITLRKQNQKGATLYLITCAHDLGFIELMYPYMTRKKMRLTLLDKSVM